MGFLDFFSRKHNDAAAAAPADPPIVESAGGYAALVPLAGIMSGGNAQVAADISPLASSYDAFRAAHPAWCEAMELDDYEEDTDRVRDAFAYWLAGYDTELQFGAYIDWKEAPDEIIAQLQGVTEALGIELGLSELEFSDDEFTDAALARIAAHVAARDYTLAVLDTDSDSYHLFLVPSSQYARLNELAESVKFSVYIPA